MDIKKYAGYFHDGGFLGANRKENSIELILRSCEILSDDFVGREILSEDNAIKGKLHLINITQFIVDDQKNKEIPWKDYDYGEILDLEIDDNKVFLLIEWINFPPKPNTNDVSTIEIEAEKIYWENIPDLPENRGI